MNNPYVAALTSSIRRTMNAPFALVTISIFYSLLLVVFAALWNAIMESVGGSLDGYTHQAMLAYMVGAEAAVAATRQQMIDDIGQDIAEKEIEPEMLRPVSMFGLRLATAFGVAFVRTTCLLPIGCALAYVFVGGLPNVALVPLVWVAALLAVACNVTAQHCVASIAFWILDVRAGWFLYQKAVFLVGAMLVPIQMLPAAMQTVIWTLPFWTMAYAPARLNAGFFEPWLLLGQLVWLLGLIGLGSYVFSLGERRWQRTGG